MRQRCFQISRHGILVALLVIISLAVRLNMLDVKDVISADGIGYVTAAHSIAAGNLEGFTNNGFYIFLIWCFGSVTPDFETAGRLVSILFGSFLVVPLYLLGSEMFSRTTALAACTITMVWPSLLNWSCEVMTQATYVTLALTGCYLAWRMCRDESSVFGFWAGCCLGLAFLTRTEAALLFLTLPIAPLWMKFQNILRMKRALFSYIASFTLLCGLHILMLRMVSGSWQLSAKTSFALNDALSYYLQIPDLNHTPGVESTGYLDIIRRYPGFIWANSAMNVVMVATTMVPPPLWILALLGLWGRGLDREGNLRRFFLLSTFSPLTVIIMFYYISPEYTQPYLPVLFLWCAEGLRKTELTVAGFLPTELRPQYEKIAALAPLTLVAAGIYGTVLFINQLPARVDMATYSPDSDEGRRDHKHIGLLLKKTLPPGKIMTRSGRIAYYADREWTIIPNTDRDGILQSARENGVRFLVLDGTLVNTRPQLADLFTPLFSTEYPERYFYATDPGNSSIGSFILIYRDPTSYGVVVRELKP